MRLDIDKVIVNCLTDHVMRKDKEFAEHYRIWSSISK